MEGSFNDAENGNQSFYMYFGIMSIVMTLLIVLSIVTCLRWAKKRNKKPKSATKIKENTAATENSVEEGLEGKASKSSVEGESQMEDSSSEMKIDKEIKRAEDELQSESETDKKEMAMPQPQCIKCTSSHALRSSQSSIDTINHKSRAASPSCSSCSVLNSQKRPNELLLKERSSRGPVQPMPLGSRLPVRRDSVPKKATMPKNQVTYQRFCKTHGLHEVSQT